MFLLVNMMISVTKIATESQLSTSINVLPWVILGCLKILEIKKYCGDRDTGMADPQMQLTHVSG